MPRRKPFRLPERIVTLRFPDGPYQGLEVDVSLTTPMALFWQLAAYDGDIDTTVEQVRDVMLLFGGQVRGWNLQGPDGAPIPATAEGFADRLDQATQTALVARWLELVRTPPESLSPGPSGRRTSARK